MSRGLGDVYKRQLVNEAFDAVHWGVATASDVELAMTKGVNYPRGLLAWGEQLGLDHVLAELDALRECYQEDRYRASPLLRRAAREGMGGVVAGPGA